jgi:hypothetical protein
MSEQNTAWLYNGLPFDGPSEHDYGFVYIITNTENQKSYVGKKLFWFKKIKTLKGKKKRYLAESDWRTYYGSSPALNQDIEAVGADKFKREIIKLCRSKGECSYYEAKTQFDKDVLLNRDMWYNDWIICRVHRKHINHEPRSIPTAKKQT